MQIFVAAQRPDALVNALLFVWEDSVQATYAFLSEKEIAKIKKYVPQAIKNVQTLLIAGEEPNRPVAFLGIENRKIEFLFVKNEERGKGLGKQLVQYVEDRYAANKGTVNEQNPQALGFYLYLGFAIKSRSETDEQGNPYPILHLELPD